MENGQEADEFISEQVVAEIPRFHAARRGDDVAVICGASRLSFGALDEHASAVANGLIGAGLRPGARVAIFAQDSTETYALMFGIAKAGCVMTGVNWRLAAPEVRFILEDGEVEAVFVDEDREDLARPIVESLEAIGLVVVLGREFEGWRAGQSDVDPRLAASPEDVIAQLYTSGTTGNPKGVRLANRSFFAVIASMRAVGDQWIGWTARDMTLHTIPLFHIAGIWWAMTSLGAGAAGVIMPEFAPKGVLDLVPRFGVTKVFMVPAMIQMTLAEPGCEAVDWESLDHIVYGGAPIPKVLLERSLTVFEAGLAQIYGLTETGNTAVCLRPEDHFEDELLLAAGKPYPGVDLKVIGPDGEAVRTGAVGEVLLRSPANMVEYWHLPEATTSTLVDGWIHTGDAGYVNERGYLFICDRIKDMILSAAENIYPAEIESVLTAYEGVLEAAVIGVPDERWGESVHAIIVPTDPLNAPRKRGLLAHCREFLADFKVPTSIEFTGPLPRTPSGKIKKTVLREPHWLDHDRRV